MKLIADKIKKSSRPISRAAFYVLAEKNQNEGFSLLELVVVVVVLGILSSTALPQIGSFLAYADIDKAKSLLNSAAADCLQKYRTDESNKDEIDETIISDDNCAAFGRTLVGFLHFFSIIENIDIYLSQHDFDFTQINNSENVYKII